MLKKMVGRGFISMITSGFVNQVIIYIMILVSQDQSFVPLVPSYAAHFSTPLLAGITAYFLVGLIGGAFGAFSVFFEIETWSFLKQGIIHFVATAVVWIPIAIYLWGLNRYPSAIVSTVISLTITYGVTWWLNFLKCKRNIDMINHKIQNRKQKEVL
ncbi:MAG TPA: DUF3021 domain-containing protein [Lachnospiraceae bacterium]|nr:DUF3021 domain-containing protein [Lachnospiraceae bacterium]